MRSSVGQFRAPVLVFFLASGATGLLMEVVWTRILGVVFGNTVYAAATVLTVFMLGMALGSATLGRWADRVRRPLRMYGWLEIGVGLYAFAFPFFSDLALTAYRTFFQAADLSFATLTAFRFVVSAALLLPPAFLMGGTLPALGRYLAGPANAETAPRPTAGRNIAKRRPAEASASALRNSPDPGREVGYLYAANTFGAVAGCFLAGFVLLRWIGISATLHAAGAAATLVGGAAVLLSGAQSRARADGRIPSAEQPRRAARSSPAASGRPRGARRSTANFEPISGSTYRLVLVAFAITGFCAMAYEVLWSRVMVFVLTTATYSFPTMLTVFLLGLALGSSLCARYLLPRIRRPLLWFGALELLVGLTVLASIGLLAGLERIDYWIGAQNLLAGNVGLLARRFADATIVLLPPTLLMGAVFPIVLRGCLGGGDLGVGRRTGQAYAANTLGCVLGSFAGGFLLMPMLGALNSLLLVVGLNLLVGVFLLSHEIRIRIPVAAGMGAFAAAMVLAAVWMIPPDLFYRTMNTYHNYSTIIHADEHPTGTITVHRLPTGETLIASCGVNVAGVDYMLRTTQKLQGYIPLLLHPSPQRVVQIGFGSGETTRVGLEMGVPDYTIVEICPAIFDAGRYFEDINHGSYRDPRLKKIIMDGKNWALLSDQTYDLVMNDSVYPGSGGGSSLYTYDHFMHCRQRLRPGGLFSCWVPLDLRPRELKMILRSFQEAFEHTTLWVASNCLNKHALILGSVEPLQIDLNRIANTMARSDIAVDLAAIDIADAYDLLDCIVCDEDAIRRMTADTPLNTDERPRLEYSCAVPVTAEGTLGVILRLLVQHRQPAEAAEQSPETADPLHVASPIERYITGWVDEAKDRAELRRRCAATNHIFRGQVAQMSAEPKIRAREYLKALRVNPAENHVASCQAELAKEIADYRRMLSLHPEQPVLAMRLADSLLVQGEYEVLRTEQMHPAYLEAAGLYDQVIKVRPGIGPGPYTNLANMRFRMGQAEEAERLLRQCVERWPGDAIAHDYLAGVLIQTGRARQARRHAEEALRLQPGNPVFQAHHQALVASLQTDE